MSTALRVLGWIAAFALAWVATVFVFAVWVEGAARGLGSTVANTLALLAPAYAGLVTLFLGWRYAVRRRAVVACATIAGIWFLAQGALVAFLAFWQRGFGNRSSSDAFLVLLAMVAIVGFFTIAAFVSRKRGN